MSALREIKSRIATVESTLKITSAMSIISSSKLHKAQIVLTNAARYEKSLREILISTYIPGHGKEDNNSQREGVSIAHPLCIERDLSRVTLVVVSSNTTLCGAFNSNAEKLTVKTVKEFREKGVNDIRILAIGKTAPKHLRNNLKGIDIETLPERVADKPSGRDILDLASRLSAMFEKGETDHIEFIYSHFSSALVQNTIREVYLPVKLFANGYIDNFDKYILEPGIKDIREKIIRMLLNARTSLILADSRTAEHAARTVAMQMATENAKRLLQELTLQYNKGRQQAITNELLDLMSGYYSA